MNIRIGKKIYLSKVADTLEDRVKGLTGTKSIKQNMGLLLKFEEPDFYNITMEEMAYPLLLVGISTDNKVVQTIEAEVGKNYKFKKKVIYVLELHPSSKVEVGEDVIYASVLKDGNMIDLHYDLDSEGNYFILDQNGNVQVEISGEERIISRIDTKKLINLFESYKENKSEKSLLLLGKHMVNVINTQDTNEPQYV